MTSPCRAAFRITIFCCRCGRLGDGLDAWRAPNFLRSADMRFNVGSRQSVLFHDVANLRDHAGRLFRGQSLRLSLELRDLRLNLLPLSKFEWVMPVVGRENEWVNGGRDVRRSEPLTRSLSQISSRAWGWRSLAAPAPEPVRRRGLPRLGAGLGVGYRHPRAVQCSKNVQILTHSIFKRAIFPPHAFVHAIRRPKELNLRHALLPDAAWKKTGYAGICPVQSQ